MTSKGSCPKNNWIEKSGAQAWGLGMEIEDSSSVYIW